MNAPQASNRMKAQFNWADPLLLDAQLTDEERMVRDAAQRYAQDKLAPRVLDAFRRETADTAVFREMGALGLLGPTLPAEYGGPELNYVCYGLIAREIERVDSGYRSMMSVQSSLVMLPIFEFGSHRAEPRLRPRLDGNAGAQRDRRLPAARRQELDQQLAVRGRVRRLGEERRRPYPRLHPGEGHEGPVGAADPRQGRPAHQHHRRDRHGRCFRPGRERAAERRGPEGSVHLPEQRALRHRLGRARRRRGLLAPGAAVRARPQAVRPAGRTTARRPWRSPAS